MEFMVLKAPPDRVQLMADAIERDLEEGASTRNIEERQQILTWLRYRLAKWRAEHPDTAAG